MNNKKALAKTFWNIWECGWVGLVRYLAIGEGNLSGERWVVLGMWVRRE